jgi:hypothetical protein
MTTVAEDKEKKEKDLKEERKENFFLPPSLFLSSTPDPHR